MSEHHATGVLPSVLEPVSSALVDLADIRPGQRVLDVPFGCDLEDHNPPDASLDVAVCRFGLMFVSDLTGTLKRLVAVLVPGGRLAAAVWGPPARCPALSIPLATMRQYGELPSVPRGAPGLFGLGGEGVIEDELNFAGFTDVQSRRLDVVFEWRSPEDFTRSHEKTVVPIHGMAGEAGKYRKEVREALLSAARAMAGSDGGVRLQAEVVVVVGKRPTH